MGGQPAGPYSFRGTNEERMASRGLERRGSGQTRCMDGIVPGQVLKFQRWRVRGLRYPRADGQHQWAEGNADPRSPAGPGRRL